MMEAVLMQNLEVTVGKERGKLLNYIRSRIANFEDAEDILQDVLVQAVKNMNVAQPIDNIMAWLYTAARNRIVDWYRKKKNRTVSLHSEEDDLSLEDLLFDSGINVERDYIRSVVMETIFESLDALPEEQREVFILQAVEGRTFREISDAAGVSINTLLARKRYAVKFLRKRLADMRDILEEEK